MVNDIIRQGGLCLTSLFANAAFTVISPFYPAVALHQGIPTYLIGFIFSAFPVAALILSLFLPTIMFKFGRNQVLIVGLLFIASSNILISFLEYFTPEMAIAASFISRILSGFGSACNIVSALAILTSDYPNQIPMLIALNEICAGFGVIIGPTVGSILFAYGGFQSSCLQLGLAVIIWIPIVYSILGKPRPYEITKKADIDMLHIIKKPVLTI